MSEGRVLERSLFIIKPDAVRRNFIGRILSFVEDDGLRIVAMKTVELGVTEAGEFYRVHKGKAFYENLVSYMSSGRCVVAVVEGDGAIRRLREICGSTDPSTAREGTIRAAFGLNVTMNSVHASDSPASADEEIHFFFPGVD